jgi:glycosyltransferase involved in cell wall biosynthesis
MKLIIQVPCFNEEGSLPVTLNELPRKVEGFDSVEWMVIDDGSTDNTVEVARSLGVDHIVGFSKNQGLAKVFSLGLESALALGADVIVNTDADNQYCAADIPALVRPILEGRAEIVIGTRPIDSIEHFSWAKKKLQKLGSWMVRKVSGTDVPDAPSGFRAISREAGLRLNVFTPYTYTLETIIQAGQKNIPVATVAVRVNEDLRPSRLVKSIPSYIKKSIVTMLRVFVFYRPFKFFMSWGVLFFSLGFAIGIRFLYFWALGSGSGHVQSLILAGALLGIGFQTILTAFLADLFSVNRQLLEDVQYRLRKNLASCSKGKKREDEDCG